jgi:hypothetical protein
MNYKKKKKDFLFYISIKKYHTPACNSITTLSATLFDLTQKISYNIYRIIIQGAKYGNNTINSIRLFFAISSRAQ